MAEMQLSGGCLSVKIKKCEQVKKESERVVSCNF